MKHLQVALNKSSVTMNIDVTLLWGSYKLHWRFFCNAKAVT